MSGHLLFYYSVWYRWLLLSLCEARSHDSCHVMSRILLCSAIIDIIEMFGVCMNGNLNCFYLWICVYVYNLG